MPLAKMLDKQVFSAIRFDVFQQIGLHADIDDVEDLKLSFFKEHPLRFIDVNWKNFTIQNHWYQDLQVDNSREPVRGTVFKFSSDITGDSMLIDFLINNITRDLTSVYDLDWEYVSLSLYIVMFAPDDEDPERIADKRRRAVRQLKAAIEQINTEAAFFKHELDLFIDEQVDLQAKRVRKMKKLYPTINRL